MYRYSRLLSVCVISATLCSMLISRAVAQGSPELMRGSVATLEGPVCESLADAAKLLAEVKKGGIENGDAFMVKRSNTCKVTQVDVIIGNMVGPVVHTPSGDYVVLEVIASGIKLYAVSMAELLIPSVHMLASWPSPYGGGLFFTPRTG